ncbi:MAG: folate-binding protein [Betaproteobacteria bacterium]
MNTLPDGMALLTKLGVIRVEGADAATFLQGQLTQDFALLGMSEARLAAFCTAKGRMQASFIGFKRVHDDILLICHADLLPAVLKRLSMFVLRAKARLTDASDAWQICGLAGSATTPYIDGQARPWSRSDHGAATVIQLYPACGVPRAMWIAPSQEPLPAAPRMPAARWDFGEVDAGIAMVSAAVAEAFVPQMLNYESVGGVNFKKGCYPGQEVVARSQFRGVLKRRALRAHCEQALEAGQEIFRQDDAEQPCATVVVAAPNPQGGWDAIVSGQVTALQSGGLHLGTADGASVVVRAMPYPLLEDI